MNYYQFTLDYLPLLLAALTWLKARSQARADDLLLYGSMDPSQSKKVFRFTIQNQQDWKTHPFELIFNAKEAQGDPETKLIPGWGLEGGPCGRATEVGRTPSQLKLVTPSMRPLATWTVELQTSAQVRSVEMLLRSKTQSHVLECFSAPKVLDTRKDGINRKFFPFVALFSGSMLFFYCNFVEDMITVTDAHHFVIKWPILGLFLVAAIILIFVIVFARSVSSVRMPFVIQGYYGWTAAHAESKTNHVTGGPPEDADTTDAAVPAAADTNQAQQTAPIG